MKKTIYINCFAGPSAGKSTLSLRLAGYLKGIGVSCEYVDEYAKRKVWEGTTEKFRDQLNISATQNNWLKILNGKVDYVVTDSPILMSATYADPKDTSLINLIIDKHNECPNVNIFVDRNPEEFDQNGRMQNLEESQEKDEQILDFVQKHDVIHMHAKKMDNVEDLWSSILSIVDASDSRIESDASKTAQEAIEFLENWLNNKDKVRLPKLEIPKVDFDSKDFYRDIQCAKRRLKEAINETFQTSKQFISKNETLKKEEEFKKKHKEVCLHETCGSCDGTGKNKTTGLECYHFLVCSCSKCSNKSM